MPPFLLVKDSQGLEAVLGVFICGNMAEFVCLGNILCILCERPGLQEILQELFITISWPTLWYSILTTERINEIMTWIFIINGASPVSVCRSKGVKRMFNIIAAFKRLILNIYYRCLRSYIYVKCVDLVSDSRQWFIYDMLSLQENLLHHIYMNSGRSLILYYLYYIICYIYIILIGIEYDTRKYCTSRKIFF